MEYQTYKEVGVEKVTPEIIERKSERSMSQFQNKRVLSQLSKRNLSTETLNINLKQNIDKSITHNNTSYTQNNTQINNDIQQSKGLFSLLFSIALLPFKMVYLIGKFFYQGVWVKYNMSEKIQLDRVSEQKEKWRKNYFKSVEKVYDFEEIY